jgi:small-conductance mechanosensitive channel
MKLLFPPRYKILGWILALPAAFVMVLGMYFDFNFKFLNYAGSGNAQTGLLDKEWLFNMGPNNFTDEIFGVLLIVGLLMIAFSREKQEDERTLALRLEALLWSVYINSVLIILAMILFYGVLFLDIMVYNICSTLIIFIARFHWVMYADRRKLQKEGV